MKIINPDSETPSQGGTIPPQSSDNQEISPEMLMMLKSAMSKMKNSGDDDRTRLLNSLKPYMSDDRKATIDSAIRMLSLSQLGELFREVI